MALQRTRVGVPAEKASIEHEHQFPGPARQGLFPVLLGCRGSRQQRRELTVVSHSRSECLDLVLAGFALQDPRVNSSCQLFGSLFQRLLPVLG